jgi:hypothetical protein
MKRVVIAVDSFDAGRSARHELFAGSFPGVLVTHGVGEFEFPRSNGRARLPFGDLPRNRWRAAE